MSRQTQVQGTQLKHMFLLLKYKTKKPQQNERTDMAPENEPSQVLAARICQHCIQQLSARSQQQGSQVLHTDSSCCHCPLRKAKCPLVHLLA